MTSLSHYGNYVSPSPGYFFFFLIFLLFFFTRIALWWYDVPCIIYTYYEKSRTRRFKSLRQSVLNLLRVKFAAVVAATTTRLDKIYLVRDEYDAHSTIHTSFVSLNPCRRYSDSGHAIIRCLYIRTNIKSPRSEQCRFSWGSEHPKPLTLVNFKILTLI